jgi:hypothetical protein
MPLNEMLFIEWTIVLQKNTPVPIAPFANGVPMIVAACA